MIGQEGDDDEKILAASGADHGRLLFADRGIIRGPFRIGVHFWWGDEELDLPQEQTFSWGEETEGADFMEPGRGDMLEEAADELQGFESHGLPEGIAGVLVAEGDAVVSDGQDTVVGDGDAVDVAREIPHDFLGALDDGFAVDHPGFFPDHGRQGFLGQDFSESLHELGAENDREGLDRNEEFTSGFMPDAVGTKAAARDKAVDVWMITHASRPGVKHAKNADLAADVPGVGRKLLERRRRTPHEQPVEFFLVGADRLLEFMGNSKHEVEIGDIEQIIQLASPPTLRHLTVAGRTAPVVAGVIRVMLVAAGWTMGAMAAQRRGAAGHDVSNRPAMAGQQFVPVELEILRGKTTEDLRDRRHEPDRVAILKFQAKLIESCAKRDLGLFGQMGIDCGGDDAVVSQEHLNRAQVNAGFQEARGIRMAQRVY